MLAQVCSACALSSSRKSMRWFQCLKRSVWIACQEWGNFQGNTLDYNQDSNMPRNY